MAAAVDKHFLQKGLLFLVLGYMQLRLFGRRIKRKHKCWVKRIFKKRNNHGQFHTLFRELKVQGCDFSTGRLAVDKLDETFAGLFKAKKS